MGHWEGLGARILVRATMAESAPGQGSRGATQGLQCPDRDRLPASMLPVPPLGLRSGTGGGPGWCRLGIVAHSTVQKPLCDRTEATGQVRSAGEAPMGLGAACRVRVLCGVSGALQALVIVAVTEGSLSPFLLKDNPWGAGLIV